MSDALSSICSRQVHEAPMVRLAPFAGIRCSGVHADVHFQRDVSRSTISEAKLMSVSNNS